MAHVPDNFAIESERNPSAPYYRLQVKVFDAVTDSWPK